MLRVLLLFQPNLAIQFKVLITTTTILIIRLVQPAVLNLHQACRNRQLLHLRLAAVRLRLVLHRHQLRRLHHLLSPSLLNRRLVQIHLIKRRRNEMKHQNQTIRKKAARIIFERLFFCLFHLGTYPAKGKYHTLAPVLYSDSDQRKLAYDDS